MKTKATLTASALLALFSTLNLQPSTAFAQGTAFTYQGRLNDGGQPATGNYDFRFSLFTTNTGGSLAYGFLTNSAIAVSNGLFTVTLDFGTNVFDGTGYWLQIGVRTNGGGTFTGMSRQELTPTPYAIFAENVSAAGINGTIPAANLGGTYGNTVNFNNGADSFDGTFSGVFYGSSFIGGNFVGNFVGTGSSLSDVWHTGGNFGTTAGANFVGTTDIQPLEFHVDNQRALRLEPDTTTNDSPNLVGGSPFNSVAPGVYGAAIGGGGASSANNQALGNFNTIGGGWGNTTGSTNGNVFQATVGGGQNNTASGISSTIAGGSGNLAYNNDAAIAGGFLNRAGFRAAVAGGNLNAADGDYGAIGGGFDNNVTTNVSEGMIGGGYENVENYNGAFGGLAEVIAGGGNNVAQGNFATIGGGYGNNASNVDATIGGGADNVVMGYSSTVAGGIQNIASGDESFVGGGGSDGGRTTTIGNHALAQFATIGGGKQNTVQPSANYSFIGGGLYNQIFGDTNGFGTGVIAGGDVDVINSNSWNSFIGGGQQNSIGAGSDHGVIAGGQFNSIQNATASATIGGGDDNVIQTNNQGSTIAGGIFNQIQSSTFAAGQLAAGTIAGGWANVLQTNAVFSVIGGGLFNQVGNADATIGGGVSNTNFGYSAMIPGGNGNYAAGSYSFAAGNHAVALYNGDFVWADSQNTNFDSTAANQVSFRCLGGVIFTSGASAAAQTVSWTPGSASWSFSSDRNLKDRFEAVDAASVLDKVTRLPIVEWSYKGYAQRHIGAMAQDFHALFPLNNDDKTLNDADLHGVELAAIQGLNQKVNEKDALIRRQSAEIADLKTRLERLEQLVSSQVADRK